MASDPNQDDPSRYKKRLDSQLEKLSVLNAQNKKTARRVIRKGRDDDVWKDSTARNHARNIRFLIEHGEAQPEYPDDATEWDSDIWNKIVDDVSIERDVGTGQKREYAYAARAFARFSIDSEAEKSDINAPTYEHSQITEDDVLELQEVLNLAESASHPRDSAMIAIMYEAALRRGALAQLDVQHYDDRTSWGTITVPDRPGVKTAANSVKPISWSKGLLDEWIATHPDPDNPEAPLFTNIRAQDDEVQRLSSHAIYTQFKRIVERSSDFDVDEVHPHILRHSRATWMRKSEDHDRFDIEQVLDWDESTSMHDRYEHVDELTEAERVASSAGIDVEKESPTSLTTCPQCRTTVPPEADRCPVCMLEFDVSAPDWFELFTSVAPDSDPLVQKWGEAGTAAPKIYELSPVQLERVFEIIVQSHILAEFPVMASKWLSDEQKAGVKPVESTEDSEAVLKDLEEHRTTVHGEPEYEQLMGEESKADVSILFTVANHSSLADIIDIRDALGLGTEEEEGEENAS